MNINPSSPQGPRKVDQGAVEGARTTETKRLESSAAPQRAADGKNGRPDSVDVSTEARALAEQSEARPAKSSLPVDRLKEVGERLASGFYDQPEVIDQVARRIAGDPDFLGRE
ncbi:MAG: hypothetical protein R2882_13355 [Gemmatimonadales bacterium]